MTIEITMAQRIDLIRMVAALRDVAEERAAIPKRSGSAPSAVRKQRRAERTRLAKTIKLIEREIVSWALATVPPPEQNEVDET